MKECHLAHCKKRNCTAKRKEIVLVQKKNCEKKPREEEGPFSVLISRLTAHSRQTDRRPATNRKNFFPPTTISLIIKQTPERRRQDFFVQKSPQEEERTEAWSSIKSQGEEGRAAGGGGSGFKTIFTSTSIPSKAEVRPEFHAKNCSSYCTDSYVESYFCCINAPCTVILK